MRPLQLAAQLVLPLAIAHALEARAGDARTTTLSSAQRATHGHAVQSFRDRGYAGAYARFAQLADAGHAPSAQLALVMHTNGTVLFGSDWSATPAQQRRWNALVINAARDRFEFDDSERGD